MLGVTGCATPMLDSTVAVPDRFAAAPTSETAPDVAWWERYDDPVLSDLIRRGRSRIVTSGLRRNACALRAGETISRSLAAAGAGGRWPDRWRTDYTGRAQAVPDMENTSGGLSAFPGKST
jgi:hypothetical protein